MRREMTSIGRCTWPWLLQKWPPCGSTAKRSPGFICATYKAKVNKYSSKRILEKKKNLKRVQVTGMAFHKVNEKLNVLPMRPNMPTATNILLLLLPNMGKTLHIRPCPGSCFN